MGYRKIFYGFIFLFDIRIAGLDILPDVIGYILIYQGLSLLKDKNKFFDEGKGLALPMIFISIFSIYQISIPSEEIYGSAFGFWRIILELITILFNLLIVYNICRGVKSNALQANLTTFESDANTVWTSFLASNLLMGMGLIFTALSPLIYMIAFIVSIITYILMMSLMHSASIKL